MSIDIKSLRVGNCYQNHSGDVNLRFTQIKYGEEIDYVAVYCDPIPLSSDLLIALGFAPSKTNFTYDYGKLSIHPPSDSYKNGRVYFNSWCIIEEPFRYLHQLQNLYFALTNEELPIDAGKIKNVLK